MAVLGRHEKNELRDTSAMEVGRMIAFFSVQPWTKKGQLTKPTDLFLLPHEKGFNQSDRKTQLMERRAKFKDRLDMLRSIPIGKAKVIESGQPIKMLSGNVNA